MSYNTPVRHLQGGSVIEVGAGGTISIAAGGSIQNAGGMSAADVTAAGTVTGAFLSLGGTVGRWAFGTSTMTAGGSAIINTGLTTIIAATSNAVAARAAVNGAAGTYTVQIDASRFANGSIIAVSAAGGTVTPGGGTFAWTAFGL